jgi:hypothetical protein
VEAVDIEDTVETVDIVDTVLSCKDHTLWCE